MKVFAYIWEYKVKENQLEAFERAYSSNGDWVQLFKRGVGHISTELHQDVTDPHHFVTIDYWTNKKARDEFRKNFKDEFSALDNHCERFTESEKLIGDFECAR